MPNFTINLTTKENKALKKLLDVTDLTPIMQKVINDWVNSTVETRYIKTKSTSQKIDELAK